MTFIPVKRKCKDCRRYYSWNPDVGKINCNSEELVLCRTKKYSDT